MSKALSVDLRTRVLAAVSEGPSHRDAAARFGVSAASVSRWRALVRTQGDARPGPLGGERRSGRVEALADLILRLLAASRGATFLAVDDRPMGTPSFPKIARKEG